MALCLSILLYGSEVWCLREDLLSRLQSFHHRCVRVMCRINISHTIRHHISSKSLFVRLGIEPIETYYHRRLLRWAGHVSRMPLNRLPRMLLTGWVANPRSLGSPQMTWGRTLKKALSRNGLPTDFGDWQQIASDRDRWRLLCGGTLRKEITNVNFKNRQSIWSDLRNGPEKLQ